MVDQEVEDILTEIRERVRATTPVNASQPAQGNGASDLIPPVVAAPANVAVARLESYLTTTARSWDRLPPIYSNRSGATARFELWLKRLLKRCSRWFTWEQVNFNAAVHLALNDSRQALTNHDQSLHGLKTQIESYLAELRRIQTELQAQLTDEVQKSERRTQALVEQSQSGHDVAAGESARLAARLDQINSQLTAVLQEVRERDERLLNEQRVCFKQLSLETSEAAILEDRGRRKLQESMQELQHRIEQLENK